MILMYDISKKKSFESLDGWVKEAQKNGGESLPIFVVGNKSDLDGRRGAPKQEVEKWCKQRQYQYFETSAKDGNGFLPLFGEIAAS